MRVVFFNKEGLIRIPWRILSFILLLAATIFLVNQGWRLAGLPGQRDSSEWQSLAFALLLCGSALVLILGLLRGFEKRDLGAIWMPFERRAWIDTLLGTLLGAVPILLVMLCAWLGGYATFAVGSFSAGTLLSAMLPTLAAVLLFAAWEEYVVRGYLFRQIALIRNSPLAAAVVTGIVFGLLHSGNPGANWQGLLFTALGGTLMGLLLIQSGSLWLVIGYHFGWNAWSGNLFGLTVSGTELGHSVWVTQLTGSQWLTGGDYGFESSIPAVVGEILTLSVVFILMTRRGPAALNL